jgi:hypothetical protein
MMTNLVDVEQSPDALQLDMPLEAIFDRRGEVSVPVFRPRVSDA